MYSRNLNRFLRKSWKLIVAHWKQVILGIIALFLIIAGIVAIWIATLRIPDLQSFQQQVLAGSTKIYDRNGVLLYDVNQNAKQEVVPFDQISPYVKNATIAIEDENFYKNNGIEVSSIIRSIFVDLFSFSFKQGGSTITQQVVKNSLLTDDKTISRKIKEWVLAIKLDRVMSKDDILNLYLNSSTYGSNYYGVEEASENYFGVKASDLDIAQAAYLAALPQAPSYYSPYGSHTADLNTRKNLVLQKMESNGFITADQYTQAKNEKVTFNPQQTNSIKAPHFSMYIKNYLIQKYGEDEVDNGGLVVTTTLDYSLEAKAEAIVKQYALQNTINFNASNAGMIVIDPTTGQILVMVGSRDYFDTKIPGNFNITTAFRQPGSTFKPFAYATAFEKGYTPDTVLFDVPTQFSTTCDALGKPIGNNASSTCYMPQNYDGNFRGPISMRDAIAQSINIPSIKVLYLAGIKDTIQTAQDMGITSLGDSNQYGLTLVLGGGEVSLLDMTSAYGVFAEDGLRNPYTGILKVTDRDGNVLEQYNQNAEQVIPANDARLINNVLSDNTARLPLNGAGSATDFPGQQIALKTGTTNDSKDAWVIGYTPNIVVGTWAGNDDNTPMVHKTSGLIVAPMWRAFMNVILPTLPTSSFTPPDPIDPNLKPVLRGIWLNNPTPPNTTAPLTPGNVHEILYWVDKSDPTGPAPTNPGEDPQYNLWETPVDAWVNAHASQLGQYYSPQTQTVTTTSSSTITSVNSALTIITPRQNQMFTLQSKIDVAVSYNSPNQIVRADLYVNNTLIDTEDSAPFIFSFIPSSLSNIQATSSNFIKVVVSDNAQNQSEADTTFLVSQ